MPARAARPRGALRLAPPALQLFGRLPGALRRPLGRTIGLAVDLLGLRPARTTDVNLALADPRRPVRDRRALARRSLAEDGILALDCAAVWTGSVNARLHRVDPGPGVEALGSARAAGRGLLLLAPHLGNWELLNLWLQARLGTAERPFTALYRPLRDPGLDAWLHDRRSRSGARLLPSDRAGLRGIARTLAAGGVVGVLPDQVPPRDAGVPAPFLGREALTTTLVRSLVRRRAAAVLAVAALRRGDRHEVHCLPAAADLGAADRRRAAAALNRTVEACIARAPAQYQWSYERFKQAGSGNRYARRR